MHSLVSVTCPKGSAERIAQEVLRQRLAACVNTIDTVHSSYWWKGKLESADESLLLMKTRSELLDALERTVKRVHPYETPEIIAFRVEGGSRGYLDWISRETELVTRKKRKPR
ncbi:MAG TPA: divalent-cation tolerance protein CutA [Nitrososphaerales archaeon]|nr:divalent-cation tolerance protein CutA [Nitrososphaerales archaeon]